MNMLPKETSFKKGKWNKFWSTNDDFGHLLSKLHYKLTFNTYKKFLDLVNIKNPATLELGCGSSELTVRILKRYGGKATVIDNSEEAIYFSIKNLKKNNIKANILKIDLLHFKPKKKFDIVHSDGLIEHFAGCEQKKVILAHKKCVKKSGVIIICVPRSVWYYRIWRKYLEMNNKWFFGYEKPLRKNELKSLLEDCGLRVLKTSELWFHSLALAKI